MGGLALADSTVIVQQVAFIRHCDCLLATLVYLPCKRCWLYGPDLNPFAIGLKCADT